MATTLQQEGEEEAAAEACDAVLVLSLGYHLPSSPPPPLPSTKPKLQEPKSVEPSLTLALSDDPYAGKKVASEEQSAGSSSFSTVKEEVEIERVSSRQRADVDDEDGTTARKKLRLTREQSALLEERFREQSTLNPKQKLILAKQLNLRPRQVEVWFQNRRARTKLKQTEVDCEFLKRCCETLTDENRRLQRELQELRAVKFTAAAAGPLYMQIPSTAIAVCPSCQMVTTDGTSKGAVVAAQKAAHLYQPFSRSPSAAC